jgi:hypothetical protein
MNRMSNEEIWKQIFKGLRSDPTIKKEVGRIQIELQRERIKKRNQGEEVLEEWFEELKKKYAKYLNTNPVFELENSKAAPPAPKAEAPKAEAPPAPAPPAPKAEAPHAAAPERVVQEGLFPVVEKPTLSTGDCFYSSIYRSLREQGLLEHLNRCKPLIILQSEREFIESIRELIAENDGGIYREIYEYLETIKKEREVYRSVLSAQGQWFARAFATGLPSYETFEQKVKAGIKRMTNWAAEIEVTIAVNRLAECGIQLRKFNTTIVEAEKYSNGMPVINLRNHGEAHWEYFSFQVPAGFTESKAYKETKKKICEEECKTYERRIDSAEKAIEGSTKEIQKMESQIEKEQIRIETNEQIIEENTPLLEECRVKCASMKGGKRKTRRKSKNSVGRRLSLKRQQ